MMLKFALHISPPPACSRLCCLRPLKDFRGTAFRTTPAQPYRFKMAAYPPLVKFRRRFRHHPNVTAMRPCDHTAQLGTALAKPGETAKPNSDIRAQVRTQRLHDDVEIMRGLAELRAWQRNGRLAPRRWTGTTTTPKMRRTVSTRVAAVLKPYRKAQMRAAIPC